MWFPYTMKTTIIDHYSIATEDKENNTAHKKLQHTQNKTEPKKNDSSRSTVKCTRHMLEILVF